MADNLRRIEMIRNNLEAACATDRPNTIGSVKMTLDNTIGLIDRLERLYLQLTGDQFPSDGKAAANGPEGVFASMAFHTGFVQQRLSLAHDMLSRLEAELL
jgi:hypothetical protein